VCDGTLSCFLNLNLRINKNNLVLVSYSAQIFMYHIRYILATLQISVQPVVMPKF
jgi:hypothetical protein